MKVKHEILIFEREYNLRLFIKIRNYSSFVMNNVGSVSGAMLLVIGLYGVLWGKKKEAKIQTNQQKPETTNEQKAESKEETTLEGITIQNTN